VKTSKMTLKEVAKLNFLFSDLKPAKEILNCDKKLLTQMVNVKNLLLDIINYIESKEKDGKLRNTQEGLDMSNDTSINSRLKLRDD